MASLGGVLRALRIDGYLLAILAAVVVALIWPAPAADGGILHLDRITEAGIALIFFSHGAALDPRTLRAEAGKWRVHALIQAMTFVVFPLLAFVIYKCSESWLPDEARIGFFFLGTLSSTISSSIALTAVGRGNVPIAIFNATVSGLLGLLITPVLLGLIITVEGQPISVVQTFERIVVLLLLPLLLGQVLQGLIGSWVRSHKKGMGLLERAVIVLIVLSTFSNATAAALWSHYDATVLLMIAVVVALLLGVVLWIGRGVSRQLGLPRADEVAFVFCGSTKSLANGAPIAKIVFGASPAAGMILLPLVFYHQLQLVVISMLAKAYARKAASE